MRILDWLGLRLRDVARNAEGDSSGGRPVETKEPLSFSDVVVFYNYVFDLGKHLDPLDAARRLLKTDVGLAAFGLGEDDVFVADRFAELQRLLGEVKRLERELERFEKGALRSLVVFALRHPGTFWRSIREGHKREAPTSGGNPITAEVEASEDERDVRSVLEETRSMVEESMARLQFFGLLRRDIDRELFRPDYLADLPFARVDLQPVFVKLGEAELGVDVGLLIHRTGIAILTFYVMFNATHDVDGIIQLSTAGALRFPETEVARALVDVQARTVRLGRRDVESLPTSKEHRDGIEWFRYRHAESVSLIDIFELYVDAARTAVRQSGPRRAGETWRWARTGEWLAYPVVFLRRPHGVPSGSRVKDAYPLEVAGIITRFGGWRDLDQDAAKAVLDDDESIVATSSWWVFENATTVIYEASHGLEAKAAAARRPSGNDWIAEELRRSSAIEPLLIQLWILRALSARLRRAPGRLGALLRVKAELVVGLEELAGLSTFMFGSLRNVMDRARVRFGIKASYEAVLSELQLVDQIISVQEARRRAARARFATLGGTTVGLILGAAGARQLVLTLASLQPVPAKKWGSTVAGAANWAIAAAHLHPALSIVVLWLAVAFIFAVLLALTVLPVRSVRSPRQQVLPKPQPVRGYEWPGARPVVIWGGEGEGRRSTERESRVSGSPADGSASK